jgi:hypothetical protein
MESEKKSDKTAGSGRTLCDLPGRASRPKLSLRLGRVAVAIAGAAVMFASAPGARAEESQANAAVTACVSPIGSCGCTITSSGFYSLANDLSSSQGLTAKNGCIDIKASKVVLNTGRPIINGKFSNPPGFNIEGPSGATPTGIGIHILKGSNQDFLELPGKIEGWDVGILVEGSKNIVEDFQAAGFALSTAVPNGTAGVEINGGSNNNINDFNVNKNLNYGIWLRGASNNQINCSSSDNNGNIGVYVGCSANGPINGKCSPAVPPSNNNQIYDHVAQNNAKYGVVIDLGNSGNIVTDVRAAGNSTMDLLDENANCDNNRWFFDGGSTTVSTTVSPACIE